MLAGAAFSMQVLQQRTLLGDIDGANDNVDLGALLASLQKSIVRKDALALNTKTQLKAAKTAYDSMVLSFQRDNTLSDVRLSLRLLICQQQTLASNAVVIVSLMCTLPARMGLFAGLPAAVCST